MEFSPSFQCYFLEGNLNFHARLELGIDPDDLGDPIKAAASSFISFAIGAFFPLVPWFFMTDGYWAFLATLSICFMLCFMVHINLVLSSIALFAVGCMLSFFTDKRVIQSGLRQFLVGALTASVTMSMSLFRGYLI